MDQNTARSLKQAVNFLKSGDAKKARSLLIDILKIDPDNDQAWYMLSFAVPNQERQIYALNQVLRINPWHEKAMKRLEKITGESYQEEVLSFEQESIISSETSSPEPPKPQDDLLAQRLFISSDEVEEEHIAPVEEPAIIVESDSELDTKYKSVPRKKKKKIKKPRKQIILPLLAKIPRRTQLLIILVLIVGTAAFLLLRDNKKAGPPITSGDFTPTSTIKLEVTPTELGSGLPPTWTPSSPGGDTQNSIFSLSSIPTPSPDVVKEISSIQTQVYSQRFDRIVEVTNFLIPNADFQKLLIDFSFFPGYQEYVNQSELVYRALGLAKSWDDLIDFPPNIWADPNGGLYLPDEGSIILQAENLEIIEKYLYVREYAQVLLDDKFSFDGLGIYPICIEGLQRCESILAVVKGDANLQADQWLKAFGPQNQIWKVTELEPFYDNLPMKSSLPFIEQELEFPYYFGGKFINALFNSGGWDMVNSAYSRVITTEQILHPDKYLSSEGAIEINDTPFSKELDNNWQLVINESIGEWMTYLILSFGAEPATNISLDTAQVAAAGWGGDQTQIYHNSRTNQFVVGIHWVWDTNNDADQFYDVLIDYIPLRFSGAEPFEYQSTECWKTFSESICVIRMSGEIIWLVTPDMDIMDKIIGLYSSES